MELSIFLAQLLGIYLIIVSVDLFLRRHEFEGAVKDFASSTGLLVFSGSVSLFLGLAIVLSQPRYEEDWRGLITLIGYILVIRGILRVAFPTFLRKRIAPLFHQGYWAIFIVMLILGLYLTYMGFTANQAVCQ